ncbi:putative membrane protein [Halorhabdus tiamatea SARL4B]|nr:DUF2298 domain-containing protein [Halorhabdus tiamatea]ERJ07033.1 putative membrane protein [Halorhabdus tiamatea SARL4B]
MEFGLVLTWLAVYLVVLFVGFIITRAVLAGLADEGAGIALPAALAIVWVVTYLLGHVSLPIGLWAGLATLAAVAVLARRRRTGRIDLSPFLETAAVFTVAFLLLVAIRAFDPAVHPGGGEKFLDFGLLRSLLRGSTLPPADFWFAGEPVQYYYGGHLLASMLARLTGTAGRYAYNLALAGFYAMVVTAAYGLAKNVAVDRELPGRLAGGLGAFFVGVASNLVPAGQLVVLALPAGLSARLAETAGFDLEGLATGLANFDYWTASRVIPGTINEFPVFAWLNGDMHAHMTSTPFLLLAATLLYGYYRTPADQRMRRLGLLSALGPLAAMLAVVNTWSFPSVGGLTVLTVALAPASPQSLLPAHFSQRLASKDWWRRETVRHFLAVAAGTAVLAIGFALSVPFWLAAASGGQGIGLFPPRSGLGPLLLVHGAFLVAFGLYFARYTMPHLNRPWEIVGLVVALLVVTLLADAPAVALFGTLILGGWALRRIDAHADGPTPGFETILIVAGAGLALLVEFVFVREHAGPGRMNTVFKVYAQVWILWSAAIGVVLAGLVADRRPSIGLRRVGWRRGFAVLTAALVLVTGIYGGLALSQHFANGPTGTATGEPTLDALAFVEADHPGEAPAIRWLDDLEGQPTIVSRPGTDIYRWVNGPSSLTGIPTVAGWVHETGYREPAAYWKRVDDVEQIFTGEPAVQRGLLAAYGVEYIYVGPLERGAYDEITVDRIDAVTVAESWNEVTIYRVDQNALPS